MWYNILMMNATGKDKMQITQEMIDSATKHFLNNGGEITVLPEGASSEVLHDQTMKKLMADTGSSTKIDKEAVNFSRKSENKEAE